MLLGALVAMIVIVVQSCQTPETDITRFAKGSLKRLHVKEAPPPQPKLTFKGPDGADMTLADYKGQVVLLNVWATWCAPCIIEMPMLDELQAERGGDDFQVVTISVDRTAYDPDKFFKDNDLTHLTPWHDSTYSLPPKVSAPGLPVSIFYSRTGREIARVSGEVDWTSDEALKFIDYVLER